MKLFIVLSLLLAACPQTSYGTNFLSVTNHRYGQDEFRRSPAGIRVCVDSRTDLVITMSRVDRATAALETCLMDKGLITKKIRRDWFGVYVPDDWYVSKCSGEQLVPSMVNCKLCIIGKGLPVPKKCCGLRKPTPECPCICNVRAAILDNWLIVTGPNLKLFKAELARLVLYPFFNNPWVEPVSACLKVTE